jgi:hypothetical protein
MTHPISSNHISKILYPQPPHPPTPTPSPPLREEPKAAPRPRAPGPARALRRRSTGDPALRQVPHGRGGVHVEAAHLAAVHLVARNPWI